MATKPRMWVTAYAAASALVTVTRTAFRYPRTLLLNKEVAPAL
jgi:hypothetical protein